jgi:hypothetical protein
VAYSCQGSKVVSRVSGPDRSISGISFNPIGLKWVHIRPEPHLCRVDTRFAKHEVLGMCLETQCLEPNVIDGLVRWIRRCIESWVWATLYCCRILSIPMSTYPCRRYVTVDLHESGIAGVPGISDCFLEAQQLFGAVQFKEY